METLNPRDLLSFPNFASVLSDLAKEHECFPYQGQLQAVASMLRCMLHTNVYQKRKNVNAGISIQHATCRVYLGRIATTFLYDQMKKKFIRNIAAR